MTRHVCPTCGGRTYVVEGRRTAPCTDCWATGAEVGTASDLSNVALIALVLVAIAVLLLAAAGGMP